MTKLTALVIGRALAACIPAVIVGTAALGDSPGKVGTGHERLVARL